MSLKKKNEIKGKNRQKEKNVNLSIVFEYILMCIVVADGMGEHVTIRRE